MAKFKLVPVRNARRGRVVRGKMPTGNALAPFLVKRDAGLFSEQPSALPGRRMRRRGK